MLSAMFDLSRMVELHRLPELMRLPRGGQVGGAPIPDFRLFIPDSRSLTPDPS
jgi:hypothetical protein